METRIKRDKLHWSWRCLDGYNKMYAVAMSAREPGKTDTTWWEKIYSSWRSTGNPWIYLVRQTVEITGAMIQDIEDTINKWEINPVEFSYVKGAFKEGIVDIKINDKLFFRIVSLSLPLRRLKLAKIPDIGGIFFDEYIIDPRSGEKYGTSEAFKIKEAYTTWRRSYTGKGFLKVFIACNPYSLFNPLFVDWGVKISELKKDEWIKASDTKIKYEFDDGIVIEDYEYKLKPNIWTNDKCAIEWGTLHPVLREYLKTKNPLYQFDEDYKGYALEGTAIHDKNIRLSNLPKNYALEFVLRMEGKYIGIFKNNYMDYLEDRYFVKFLDEVSARRTIYCFEFSEMVDHSILMSIDERSKLQRYKTAMRKRLVTFEDINVYYYMEEIYKNL